jgi:hypothetical protein
MDASEDEEVFLPPLPTEKSVSDNNFHSNVENIFDNDLDNATIPNLIFENKNLVNSYTVAVFDINGRFCDDDLSFDLIAMLFREHTFSSKFFFRLSTSGLINTQSS